jgi:hypothetical protein
MISELERIILSYVNVIYGKNKKLYIFISKINSQYEFDYSCYILSITYYIRYI